MAQMIIYAGAIMVLFLFVVMLLNAPQEDAAEWDRTHPLRRPGVARIGILLAVVLVAELGWALTKVVALDSPVGARADGAAVSSVRELGQGAVHRLRLRVRSHVGADPGGDGRRGGAGAEGR